MANFDPSQNRNPWADCNKIPHNWLRPREDPQNQIWYKCIHYGLQGIWVKCNVFVPFFIYLFIPFLWDSRTGQTGWWIFTRDSSLDVKSRKDVPFGGLNNVPLNFGRVKLPKNSNFGGVNRTFKPERQKFQTLITWKLLIRSWQNFNREYAARVCLRGWSHGSPTKSKMAAAAIFNFGKMSITSDWIKISAPNFMGHNNCWSDEV